MKKRLVENQPNFNDLSQYNFKDTDSSPYDYEDSTGLPKNRNKFTKKDLYTQSVGDELNEKIIEANLKFSGQSFIRIDNIKIKNAGVNYDIRGIDIRGFVFSKEKINPFKSSGGIKSYHDLINDLYPSNAIDDVDSPGFFRFTRGSYNEGGSPGNLSFIEGANIIEDLTRNAGDVDENDNAIVRDIKLNDFNNRVNDDWSSLNALKLKNPQPTLLSTHVFDEAEFDVDSGEMIQSDNPIYFAFWMKGDADRWWGTDKRKRRIQIFEINNRDLFDDDTEGITNNQFKPRAHTFTFSYSDSYKTTGGGGSGGAEAAAFIVDSFQVSISTIPGQENNFADAGDYEEFINTLQPTVAFEPKESNQISFLTIGPDRQLNNIEEAGNSASPLGLSYPAGRFPDFFPKTFVNVLNQDGKPDINNLIDLQSYYEDNEILSLQTSAPATIGFSIVPSDLNLQNSVQSPFVDEFFYYVVDWDDKDDKIKTVQDALESRPDNVFDLLNVQEQGLYELNLIDNSYFDYGKNILLYMRDNFSKEEIMDAFSTVYENTITERPDLLSYFYQEWLPDNEEEMGVYIPWYSTIPGFDYDQWIENNTWYEYMENFLNRDEYLDTSNNSLSLLNQTQNFSFTNYYELSNAELQLYYFAGLLYVNGMLVQNSNTVDTSMTEILGMSDDLLNIIRDTSIMGQVSHTYNSPGIKTIKVVMFSYNHEFKEPGRWKLVKMRFYLDIPINQYPDFHEVGGADYKTLPWPYTTPIIGGTSENSKYKKSVRDTLGGGKIGDVDIIDERFLVNDVENDETGESITKFDLEQCRYFNKSYGMNDLLGITEPYHYNDSPSYLATLPFPQYFEEFDIDGNGGLDNVDISRWIRSITNGGANRPDIHELVVRLLGFEGGMSTISESHFIYPDYVFDWVDEFSIPSGGEGVQPIEYFYNPSLAYVTKPLNNPYYDISGSLTQTNGYWNGVENKFSEETSVGQIFIDDNQDADLKQNCKMEISTGNLSGKSIYDSSGNSNKGILIGDYRIKKSRKGEPMKKDSFIKLPKKTGKTRGAL